MSTTIEEENHQSSEEEEEESETDDESGEESSDSDAEEQIAIILESTVDTIQQDKEATTQMDAILDLNLDQLENKPWRQPGADITRWFNYGFTEETWKQYCMKQQSLRRQYPNSGSSASRIKVVNSSSQPVPDSRRGMRRREEPRDYGGARRTRPRQ